MTANEIIRRNDDTSLPVGNPSSLIWRDTGLIDAVGTDITARKQVGALSSSARLRGARERPVKRMKRQLTRVLVVDKRPVIRAGIKAMLRAKEIRGVEEVGTARQVLRLLRAAAPKMVLLGDRIEEADGLDLLRRIKEKWPKVPVIMVTANESPAYLSRALALGCSGYLQEWVGREELLKTVRAVDRGESVVEPPLLRSLLEEVGRQIISRESGLTEQLTFAEQEVLRLITEGQTNRDIAQRLGYSMGTVKDYVQKIIQKLQVSDRTQAAVKATRLGLLD